MPTAIGAYATTALLKSRLGITDVTDDTLLGSVCDQTNQFIETFTERVLAPVSSAAYIFDGGGAGSFYFPRGIRAVTLLELANYTGGTFATVASTDYFLRPFSHERPPGWPATWINFSDYPAGSYNYFPTGYGTVRITMTTGWDAIPDDIIDVALTTATRAWHARQNGQADIVGSDDTGAPIVSRFVAPHHWGILNRYAVGPKLR